MWNNVLSKDELEYYQSKIGSDYKITSPQGISGAHATAYNLEDTHGKRFILKIPNNPQNAAHWIQNQRKTQENIHKYYSDYKGSLKIPNYIKISDDFVIEENLGKSIDSVTLENFDDSFRADARSMLGVAYAAAEFDSLFLVNRTHDGVFPKGIDKFRK